MCFQGGKNKMKWKLKWNESGFRPPLCTYRLNWARRTSWHRIRNSSPGGLRPSTLPPGHGGSPQYWLSHVHGEETFLFLSNRRDREPSPELWRLPTILTVFKVAQQLFIEYISKQYNTFSVAKYAETVNYWSSYAFVDGSLESMTLCITHDTITLERVSACRLNR